MNFAREIRTMLRTRSGKGLLALSLAVFLLLTAIVFYATFTLCEHSWVRMMEEYLWEMPAIIESRSNDLLLHSDAVEKDILTRAEVGQKLYLEEATLSEVEKLAWVQQSVSAASVSLIDGQGTTLATTGPVSPEANFRECVQTLDPGKAHLAFFEKAEGKSDGKGFVILPLAESADGSAGESTNRSLVFEFSIDQILELYNGISDCADVLEGLIGMDEGAVFARVGGVIPDRMVEGLPADQGERLRAELNQVFQDQTGFRRTGSGMLSGNITLLGKRFLAMKNTFAPEGLETVEILLTLPVQKVIGNGIYIALAISAIIGWGMLLLQRYLLHRLQRAQTRKAEANRGASDRGAAGSFRGPQWRIGLPGLAVMIAVTMLFSTMLLLLESRSNATMTALSMREFIGQEINWRKSQEGTIQSSFENYYRTRTQMLAAYLAEHPEKETRSGLEELRRIAGAEYVMLFDRTGLEQLSSNSYTDFTVGKNLSEEYRAVLLGYPYTIVGPAADTYTGRTQIGAAIMMQDAEGKPHGFLLAVYSAAELNKTLKSMSYENAVNTFKVWPGHFVAAIRDEDGRFIAHTDPRMIGQKAADFMEDYQAGTSFEGFTDYQGEEVCLSARAADGKTLLYIMPEHADAERTRILILLSLAVALILALGYYPQAVRLIGRAMETARLQPQEAERNPLALLTDGYAFFLLLFVIVAVITTRNGWWTTFSYVFNESWSAGLNLYSLWAALFILAITLSLLSLAHWALRRIEARVGLHGRTVARLADSLVTYAAYLFLVFRILTLFGVNTTALVASAGIVSIAVGMGAQSMASDLLAGFFMMFEGSVRVGDQVSIGNMASGVVTDMGIRTTEITDADGNVVILNNSKVSPIRNMSRKEEKPEDPEDGTPAAEEKPDGKPAGEKPADGKTTAEEKTDGKTAAEEKTDGKPAGEKPAGRKTAEKKPASEKPAKQKG